MPPRAVDGRVPRPTTAYAAPHTRGSARVRRLPRALAAGGGARARRLHRALAAGGGARARRLQRGLAALAGAAAAAATASAPAAALPADPPTGGVTAVGEPDPFAAAATYGAPAPRVLRVTCRRGCGAAGAARPGALVRVWGRRLGRVSDVLFLAGQGVADDTSVAPRAVYRRSVLARVPRTAATGAVALALADGTRSAPSRRALVVDASGPALPARPIDAEVQSRKVFFGAGRPAELSFVLGGTAPATVVVELLRVADDVVIASWTRRAVAPGIPETVRWRGTAGGRVQREGDYRFRVRMTRETAAATLSGQAARTTAAATSGATTGTTAATTIGDTAGSTSAATTGEAAGAEAAVEYDAPGTFTFLRHRFPIIGAHTYGTGAAAFGGGRGHQGQDVFAACGTPVVAARGGRVAVKEYEGRAGNYVVIDGAATGVDYAYMHLRDAALVDVGDRVRTGQLIGFVGSTGRASGCHLHFEMWSGPGWYAGGAPFDPLPRLRGWDRRS